MVCLERAKRGEWDEVSFRWNAFLMQPLLQPFAMPYRQGERGGLI